MAVIVSQSHDPVMFDWLLGTSDYEGLGSRRWHHLIGMANHAHSIQQSKFLISARDIRTNSWMKWRPIWTTKSMQAAPIDGLMKAYDLHRSVLDCEVVVESDYETYEENRRAARIIGAVLEGKGYTPHYYFSGSKSIHVHVFLDFSVFTTVDEWLQERIKALFGSRYFFVKRFMEWFRELAISCWGTEVAEFDRQLVRASHLIRSELSLNKIGFKTFCGYHYGDVPITPPICNKNTGIKPRIASFDGLESERVVFSRPHSPQEVLEEFLAAHDEKQRIVKTKRKERSLEYWMNGGKKQEVRPIVRSIMTDSFASAGDGFHRAMWIILNELLQSYGQETARALVHDWNARMGSPVKDSEIDYRINNARTYLISNRSIEEFLLDIKWEP